MANDPNNKDGNNFDIEQELEGINLMASIEDDIESGFGHLEVSQDELDDVASQLGHNNESDYMSDDFGFDEENMHY